MIPPGTTVPLARRGTCPETNTRLPKRVPPERVPPWEPRYWIPDLSFSRVTRERVLVEVRGEARVGERRDRRGRARVRVREGKCMVVLEQGGVELQWWKEVLGYVYDSVRRQASK